MSNGIRRFLAMLMATVLIISLTACAVDTDALIESAQGQFNEVVEDAKEQIGQAAEDAIQDAADAAKDKVNEWLNGSGNQVSAIKSPKISITMLDVGQGLSILVESDGNYMIYDGGDRGTSSYVVAYLEKHNVKHLDYLIASHYDSDHLAGLVGVLETTSVDTVINPDFKATSKIYQSYVAARDASGADVIYPKVGDTYKLGYSTITVLAPAQNYDDANEASVAIKIQCDDFACVITGDAEGRSEADMLDSGIDLSCDLYVVGHHGSSSSSSDDFVKAMGPAYGFISCGKDNDYGHPTEKTLNTLAKYNTKIYRFLFKILAKCICDSVRCASDFTIHIGTINFRIIFSQSI